MVKNPERLVDYLVYQIKQETDRAVIGVSGGADSTLVAALCCAALGPSKVHTVSLPYGEVDSASIKAGKTLADCLHTEHSTIDILPIVKTLNLAVDISEFEDKTTDQDCYNIAEGNVRARIRMTLLYYLSNNLSDRAGYCRVVGTGNLSEDYIGYDTKGGDALCDFFPIGALFKSEVYQLLDYFVSIGTIDESMINRVPSAGLWVGQTDEEELGYSYDELEPAIRRALAGSTCNLSEVDYFVRDMHKRNKHKHEAPKVIPVRLVD